MSPSAGDPSLNARGIAWAVTAAGLFVLLYVSGKLTGNSAAASQIVWLRYLGGLATVTLLAAGSRRRLRDFTTRQPHIHAIRAAAGSGGVMAAIHAASNMPVADATAIGLLESLFTVLLAMVFLKESVSPRQWGAALICLAGATLILAGSGLTIGIAPTSAAPAAVALIGALLFALESILIKRLARSESVLAVLLYVNLFAALLFTAPALWQWRDIQPAHGLLFLLLGPLAITGQTCNLRAYRLADAALLAPTRYVSILFGVALGWLLFGERLSPIAWLGSALILLGGIVLAGSTNRAIRNVPPVGLASGPETPAPHALPGKDT